MLSFSLYSTTANRSMPSTVRVSCSNAIIRYFQQCAAYTWLRYLTLAHVCFCPCSRSPLQPLDDTPHSRLCCIRRGADCVAPYPFQLYPRAVGVVPSHTPDCRQNILHLILLQWPVCHGRMVFFYTKCLGS